MVNYQNSKLYKIEPIIDHEEGDIYIGSTTKTYLSQRMDTHRADYKRWKLGKGSRVRSFDLFDKYGIDNCQILLIESYPCETRDELTSREGHFIRTLKCVNKNVAGRSYKETCKQYYENNSDKINEKRNEKLLCVCGFEYTRQNYSRHCKSKKHQSYINTQNIILDV